MSDANTELLSRMAEALGELRERLVFVGGCATALLITDPAAAPARATQDVDAVVAVASTVEYQRLGEALRARGFSADDRRRRASLPLDVARHEARSHAGPRGSSRLLQPLVRDRDTHGDARGVAGRSGDRLVTPACFLATKLEAFEDRGAGDYLESHDLEDVLSVVDGRPDIVAELAQAEPQVCAATSRKFSRSFSPTTDS